MEKTKIGIVIADELEYAPFVRHFSGNAHESFNAGGFEADRFELDAAILTAVHCGIGKVNAAAAAATLIHLCGVQILLNEGLSGGVQMKRSGIIIGTRFVEHDFDLTPLGRSLGSKPGEQLFIPADEKLLEAAKAAIPGAVFGTLGSGDSFIADAETTALFIREFDEYACDMESAAIASVAKRNGIPFLAVRKISDSADENATNDYNELNDLEEADLAVITEKIINNLISNR